MTFGGVIEALAARVGLPAAHLTEAEITIKSCLFFICTHMVTKANKILLCSVFCSVLLYCSALFCSNSKFNSILLYSIRFRSVAQYKKTSCKYRTMVMIVVVVWYGKVE